MAVIDSKLLLSEDVALPASATTEYSTNVVDLGAGKDEWGAAKANPLVSQGTPMFLNIVMNTGASTGSSPTARFILQNGAATDPTDDTMFADSGVIAAATLVAGYKLSIALPIFPSLARFLRLEVIAGTAGFTTGTYTAWIDIHPIANV